MDKSAYINTGHDLVKLLQEYPGFLEIFVEDKKGNLFKIRSIRWEEGGAASWLVLSPETLNEG